MKELRIRNFPPELLKALHIEAAQREVSLRELVIEALTSQYMVAKGSGYWKKRPEYAKPKKG